MSDTKADRFYATGRRKEAVARVWIQAGTGKFSVNGHDLDRYFPTETHRMLIQQPLEALGKLGEYDVMATIRGGGSSGQAGALRFGLSRALVSADEEYRKSLRRAGLLTRDSREVERKKYGQPGARKRFQFSKR